MTLLTYHSKYIVPSAITVTTSSSTLSDDTPATQTFSLASTKTVLIIYTANSEHLSTNGVGGMKNAINVDGTDVSQMNDSGYAANHAYRNTCMWVGSLNSGSHTINGRRASAVNAQTTTVDNRTLLIYIFNGDEFRYIDDTTAQTASSTTYIDDSVATTTFTPSGDCEALAFYAITNLKGSTERYDGKRICINIAGVDKYCESSKSSNSAVTSPDSLATVYVETLTAVSTTIKGRLSTNAGTQTVTANRHVLGVLLLDPSNVLDLVSSVTSVSRALTTLANDTQASITRVRGTTNELLIFGQATKHYGTTGSLYGLCYGLNVDGADVALSRSSPAYTSDAESSFVTYATTVAAGSHTINGRFATNYSDVASKVDTRILIALWFPSVTIVQIASSRSGGGSLTASLSNINRINSTVLGGGSQTSSLTVWSSPTANFSGTPLTGYLPLTVQFTDSSTVPTSIVDNSDFEAGLPANTTGMYTSRVQSGTYKRHGTYSMSAIAINATEDSYISINQSVLSLTSNTQYYWEIYVYSPDGATIYPGNMVLQEHGGAWRGLANGAINGSGAVQSLPAGSWVKICGTGTTGSGWGPSRLVLRPAGSDGAWDTTHYIYYDDLKVYPITWAWTFGDTTTSSAQNPSHQYTSKGVYAVGLTVTNVSLSSSRTYNSYVTVNELLNIYTSVGSQSQYVTSDGYYFTTSDNNYYLTHDVTLGSEGGGSQTAMLSINKSIASSINANASETANIIEFERISSSLSGNGSQSSSIIIFTSLPIVSSISAGGSQNTNVIEFERINSTVLSVGSETAIIKELKQIISLIGGGGSQTSNPITIKRMVSSLTGGGSPSATIIITTYLPVSFSIFGGGSETAIAQEFEQIISSIYGSGSQTSNPITFERISSILAAAGALIADVQLNTGTVNLYSFRVGSGSETANMIEFEKTTSIVIGGGLQNAALSSRQIITSAISGMGTSTANIIKWNYISSDILGMGAAAANIIEWNYISSNILGVGSQTSNIARLGYIASVISGFGSTQAAISVNKNIYSIVSGSGSQTADDIVFGFLNGIVIGIGNSSAHLTVIIIATPHFDHPQTLIINQTIRAITIFRNERTVTIENGIIQY